jgi:hypothetical protein
LDSVKDFLARQSPQSAFRRILNSDNTEGALHDPDPRPEGPEENRPDRKVGIRLELATSAEGAALDAKILLTTSPLAQLYWAWQANFFV